MPLLKAFVKDDAGTLHGHQRRHRWKTDWNSERVAAIARRLAEIGRRSNSTTAQAALFQRLTAGLGNLQHGTYALTTHERLLSLWVALESLVTNLPIDDVMGADTAPIGARVAYRAALLRPTPATMSGLKQGVARWGVALELDGIYWLRNRIVHKGQRHPAVDDILLRRFEKTLVSTYMQIVVNAFRHPDLTSVEEMLAWREHVEPNDGDVT